MDTNQMKTFLPLNSLLHSQLHRDDIQVVITLDRYHSSTHGQNCQKGLAKTILHVLKKKKDTLILQAEQGIYIQN